MNKITKIFAITVLSAIASSHAIFAAYPSTSVSGQNPSGSQATYYDQNQSNSDQYTPGTSAERTFQMNARDRFNRLRQENRNMSNQDRMMIREGYDSNEAYDQEANRPYQGQYQQFRKQEQYMRGDQSYSQSGYAPSTDAGTPQSYSLDPNSPNTPRGQRMQPGNYYGPRSSYRDSYGQQPAKPGEYDLGRVGPNERHPSYEYMMGKDGKWQHVATHHDDSQIGYNTQDDTYRKDANQSDRAAPESYPLDDSDSQRNQNDDSNSNPSTMKRGNTQR